MDGNPITPNVELKPNSDRSKEEHEVRKPVVSGKVKTKKGSIGRKFAETFFTDDVSNVKHYIFFDVLLPGIRDGLYDIFSGSLSMMLYGDSGRRNQPSKAGKAGYVNYSNYSSNKKDSNKKRRSMESAYFYNDVIFESREDANDVKYSMQDILERYKMVTVADFYELSGEESDWTDQKFGWFDLDSVTLVRDRDGYKLKLPKAVPLD